MNHIGKLHFGNLSPVEGYFKYCICTKGRKDTKMNLLKYVFITFVSQTATKLYFYSVRIIKNTPDESMCG